MTIGRLCALLGVCCLAVGCATGPKPQSVTVTPVFNAPLETPEDQLLDVGIGIFETDVDEDEDKAVPSEIRQAESRFVPVHLKGTMQRTGHWGAVRVIPTETDSIDVFVTGTIKASDGEELIVSVEAYDASGRKWFSKAYEATAKPGTYQRTIQGERDAFQDLYNTIANDLATYRAKLGPVEIENIRHTTELRFAANLAPEAFGDYLVEDETGVFEIQRLPAHNDPMLARVQLIREREYLLVDTVNAYYDNFYDEMWGPYEDWRNFRSQEAEAQREIRRKALNRKLLGAAAIIGAIAIEALGGGGSTAGLRNLMIIGGSAAVASGFSLGQQTKIHADAIRELDDSFDAEVTPLVVEVEGETVELTGSAEAQFEEWRKMLRHIYINETGLIGRAQDTDPARNDIEAKRF